jgi:hypothetical protein
VGTVTAARLLNAWESSLDEPVARRGAAVVAGCRGLHVDDVSRWNVAMLNDELFQLRAELFGTAAEALTDCPSCRQCLELELDVVGLNPAPMTRDRDVLHVVDGYSITAKWPSSDDVAAACAGAEKATAAVALLERCVESVLSPSGEALQLPDLPRDVGTGIREWMSLELESAEALLEVVCDVCDHQFQVPFDIASFLLSDVDSWAGNVLREIHVLASAHGWTEAEVLALSARRRRHYIDLIEEH